MDESDLSSEFLTSLEMSDVAKTVSLFVRFVRSGGFSLIELPHKQESYMTDESNPPIKVDVDEATDVSSDDRRAISDSPPIEDLRIIGITEVRSLRTPCQCFLIFLFALCYVRLCLCSYLCSYSP